MTTKIWKKAMQMTLNLLPSVLKNREKNVLVLVRAKVARK